MSTEPAAPRPSLLGFADTLPTGARTPIGDGRRFAEQLDSAARPPEPARAEENNDPAPAPEQSAPADSQDVEQSEAAPSEDSASDAENNSAETPDAEGQADGSTAEEPQENEGVESFVAPVTDQATDLLEPLAPAVIEPAADLALTTETVNPEAESAPGVAGQIALASETDPDALAQPSPQPASATAEPAIGPEPRLTDEQLPAIDAETIGLESTGKLLTTGPAEVAGETGGDAAPPPQQPVAQADETAAAPGGIESTPATTNRQGQNTNQQSGGENAQTPTERIIEAGEEEAPLAPATTAVTRASTEADIAAGSGETSSAAQPTADASAAAVDRAESPRPAEQAPAEAPRVDRTPTIDSARFLSRVTRAIDLANERGGPIQLRLSPPELGSLQVRIQLREGVLTASLEAETPAARQTLLDNLPALRDRLEQQQIRIDKFDVDVRDDSGQRGGDYQPHDDNGGRPERDTNPRQPTAPRTPAAEASTDSASPEPTRTIHFGDDTINLVA